MIIFLKLKKTEPFDDVQYRYRDLRTKQKFSKNQKRNCYKHVVLKRKLYWYPVLITIHFFDDCFIPIGRSYFRLPLLIVFNYLYFFCFCTIALRYDREEPQELRMF